jgi:hypothetical protein
MVQEVSVTFLHGAPLDLFQLTGVLRGLQFLKDLLLDTRLLLLDAILFLLAGQFSPGALIFQDPVDLWLWSGWKIALCRGNRHWRLDRHVNILSLNWIMGMSGLIMASTTIGQGKSGHT